MTPAAFTIAFLAALAASLAIRLALARRHVAHIAANRGAVPTAFAERIALAAHQKAADYTIAKTRFGTIGALFDALLLLVLTFGGGLGLLVTWTGSLPVGPLWQDLALIVAFVVITDVLDLPFTAWQMFVIEARFGFNRMTLRLWLADLAKGTLLGALLGLPLAALALWLMRTAGALWWLWLWMVWIAFQLLLFALYPTLIAPLFNRFTPMSEGPARDRIESLLTRCGFAGRGLFVMDGSRRSSHGNAFFTGFGRGRRIVFFDTLLSRLDPDEVEAVLAHELGHFKLKHVAKRLFWLGAGSLVFLVLLAWLAASPWFYAGLGVPAAVDRPGVALILFTLVLPAFGFLLAPLSALYSRRHEFEADAFAVRQTSASALSRALVKLYQDNASTLTPDPLHSAYHDSHPPAAIRIARLNLPGGESGGEPPIEGRAA